MGALDQARDAIGRFLGGGDPGSRPSEGKANVSKWAQKAAGRMAEPMTKIMETQGGFTHRPSLPGEGKVLHTPKDGIMVSRAPGEDLGHVVELSSGEKDFDPVSKKWSYKSEESVHEDAVRECKEWLKTALPALKKLGPDHYLGGWVEKDASGNPKAMHFDISQRFKPEHKDKAVAAGRERNQMAVFDLKTFQEIPTGGTGR
jgi:hypothetical protein